jgi:hypothetical protein
MLPERYLPVIGDDAQVAKIFARPANRDESHSSWRCGLLRRTLMP